MTFFKLFILKTSLLLPSICLPSKIKYRSVINKIILPVKFSISFKINRRCFSSPLRLVVSARTYEIFFYMINIMKINILLKISTILYKLIFV